ncbi:MAG: hypothetical protein QM783_10190 [Phycisphaerales bacterium]
MHCCNGGGPDRPALGGAGHPTPGYRTLKGTARRLAAAMKWATPIITLALVPKCPMCVMAYVAAATGLGLSYTQASWLRVGVIWVCVGAIVALAGRAALRTWAAR